jgi:hypothetical protein
MVEWTKWIDIDTAKSLKEFEEWGVYQIRLVDQEKQPIPIDRMAKVDGEGLLYVGRSGYRTAKTDRTLANRIKEFDKHNHSGALTYFEAKETLKKVQKFRNHRLQVRAKFLSDEEINPAEVDTLSYYFSEYAELPPCNSSLPKKRRHQI